MQETTRAALERLQWELEKGEASHMIELEKARTNSLANHNGTVSELKEAQALVNSIRGERDVLQRKVDELALETSAATLNKETKEMCDMLLKDNARQKAECSRLKAQSESANKRVEAAEKGITDNSVTELKSELEAKDSEIEEYLGELAEIGEAYEGMKVQNTRLLDQLRDKEDSNTRLVSEKIKAKQIESLLRSKHEGVQRQLAAATKAKQASELVQVKLDAQLKCSVEQVQNLLASESLVNQLLESHKHSARQALEQFNTSRSQLEVSQASLEGMVSRSKANVEALNTKTAEHQRASEDAASLTKKLDYLQKIQTSGKKGKSGSAAENELTQLKALISCPVQNDQRIGMDQFCVIAKCWHCFSRSAINTNLANRNRKCPACGLMYDKADVHDIFITN